VDSFDFLLDESGSMMMRNAEFKIPKIAVGKEVLAKINSAIPDLGYFASLHTFAPASTILPTAPWSRAAMAQQLAAIPDNLDIFNRLTPMGPGIVELTPEFARMKRPAAVVLVSDGAANLGSDPVAEVTAVYQQQPGLCFHVISLADTAEGQATLDKIAALKNCTVTARAADLLNSQSAVDKFVADVFYSSAGMQESIVLHGVNFAFDSSALDAKARGILDEVAVTLRSRPAARITLEGWTDSVGTDAYNAGLSQRRANAVRDYLVSKGIPASSITTVGRGESFKYDNRTADGRYLNRRTELLF
jgi:OOP family OmpA-OmpF porin